MPPIGKGGDDGALLQTICNHVKIPIKLYHTIICTKKPSILGLSHLIATSKLCIHTPPSVHLQKPVPSAGASCSSLSNPAWVW
jgi:hypothetical protein